LPDSSENIIGMCLREARKAAGYDNAGQAAAKVNRSPETVGRHERGDIPLSTEDAIQYAEAYGRPDIMIRYCDDCRIHQALCGARRIHPDDLASSALKILAKLRKSPILEARISEIFEDGIVRKDEIPALENYCSMLMEFAVTGNEFIAACMVNGILKDAKKAAPTGMGATERAKITLSKADQIAHSYCNTRA